jgi:Pentapeptide repeats (8 copies)
LHVLSRWAAGPRGIWWVLGWIAAVVVVLAVAWVLFVPAADWLATHDVGSVTGPLRIIRLQSARDAARGRLLTLGAGLFAFGALIYTARNFTLSREGQVTDRYTKAIEQLGSDKLDVRIGGIYALERVARDSAKDHPTVMGVLAAFVREHSREAWPLTASGSEPQPRRIRPDVQAAITVIGRRKPARDLEGINLADVNLAGADLEGANLSSGAYGKYMRKKMVYEMWERLWRTSLRHADLADARLIAANLFMADLSGADLSRAWLIGADLAQAYLTDADLSDADLRGANLSRTSLRNTNLTGALLAPNAAVPMGWERDTDSGRLKRAETSSGDTAPT